MTSSRDGSDENTGVTDKTSIVQSDTFKLRIAQAGEAPPCLVLLVGPAHQVGRQWPIENTDWLVGRSPTANICVDDRSMSKSHAKIRLVAGDVSIEDLHSTNKTLVNGKVLAPGHPAKLRNNDQIKMGNIVFKFLERGNLETVASAQTFDRGITDGLTGIHNRRALDARGPEAINRATLLNIPITVIVFDIDHFKRINDSFGHVAGDFILKELASAVRTKLLRENDFFARSGGEEFCALLLGTPPKISIEVAERLRTTIESHIFEFENKVIPVTVSIGVAVVDAGKTEGNEWKALYDKADKALYASKNAGRNRVTVAPD